MSATSFFPAARGRPGTAREHPRRLQVAQERRPAGGHAYADRQKPLTPTVVSANSQPFNTGPIIDQNGVFTRFEILVNKTMFDYILSNSLYSKAGQKAFTPPVNFTSGSTIARGRRWSKGPSWSRPRGR